MPFLSALCIWGTFLSMPACHQPRPETKPSGVHPLLAATQEAPWTNELGMEFIPVPGKPGVYLCRTETRIRDFRAYAAAAGYRQKGGARMLYVVDNEVDSAFDATAGWENPGFDQSPDHPVCCVSLEEAKAFCAWLSSKDPRLAYRLPSDEEWTAAAGTGDRYPWGSQWPRPLVTGNYWGKEAVGNLLGDWSDVAVYDDGYARTAPVASFPANARGFFDLGGNVWEKCGDRYRATMLDPDTLAKYPDRRSEAYPDGTPYYVLRGGAWSNFTEMEMRTSYRSFDIPTGRSNLDGFRCAVEVINH